MSDNGDPKTAAPSASTPSDTPRPESLLQPFAALRNEMDRLIENFRRSFGPTEGDAPRPTEGDAPRPAEAGAQPLWRAIGSSFGVPSPAVDVVESEREYRITAELPGMDAKDIDISISDDMLILKGEKREEREEKAGNYHRSERRFGSFQRSFQLPRGVDRDGIEASFERGLLTLTLPKMAEASVQRRKIDIRQGS